MSIENGSNRYPTRNCKSTDRIFGPQAIQASRRKMAEDIRKQRLGEMAHNSRVGGETEAQHLSRIRRQAQQEQDLSAEQEEELIAEAEEYYNEQDLLCEIYEDSMQLEFLGSQKEN